MARLAMAVLVHGFVFFLAVVLLYAGLGVGLAASQIAGVALWVLAALVVVGNVAWILRRLLRR